MTEPAAQYTPNRRAEILTVAGDYFQFEDRADTGGMGAGTIAHALALTNRFGGHTYAPYSVAEHSVRVSHTCDPEDALWGLMHDASEAYLNDIVSPAKANLPDYRWLEQEVMDKIIDFFGLSGLEIPASVHRADLILCATEARDLMPPGRWQDWNLPHEPLLDPIIPWGWQYARQRFIDRYIELTTGS